MENEPYRISTEEMVSRYLKIKESTKKATKRWRNEHKEELKIRYAESNRKANRTHYEKHKEEVKQKALARYHRKKAELKAIEETNPIDLL